MTLALTEVSNPEQFLREHTSWVLDNNDLRSLISILESAEQIIFDLETTGLYEHAEGMRIVLAAFTIHPTGDTYILPLAHPESPWSGSHRLTGQMVFNAIKQAKRPISNQNIKFDCRWVYACYNVDLAHQIVWDTRIGSHILDENISTKLKVRASETFDIPRWDDGFDFSRVRADQVNLIELGIYAAHDTFWTWMLERHQRHVLNLDPDTREEPEGPEEVEYARLGQLATWTAMPQTATLTAIEQRGMWLDTDWVFNRIIENEAKAEQAFNTLVARYYRLVNDMSNHPHPEVCEEHPRDCNYCEVKNREPSFAPTSLYFKAWAAIAVREGDLVIDAMTKNGNAQWSKAILNRQSLNGRDAATDLLTYRAMTKQLEFLRSWQDNASELGKIHTTYNQGSVVTGRLSSSSPNMQQVTQVLKPAYIPSPDFYIAELDYSQIELRVAAFISRCKPMIEAFQRGDDLHKLLAARITGKAPDAVNPDERQKGKSANFGLLFTMGAAGFQKYAEDQYNVSMTLEEAQEVHTAFFEMWPGIGQWHNDSINRARRDGQIANPIGRVRRLPDIYDNNPERVSTAERQSINSPVQGFAADMTLTAAASIEGTLPGYDPVPDVRLIGTVHDSLVVEVPIHDWRRATARCMHRMINVTEVLDRHYSVKFDVPLAVEAKIGTRWGLKDVGVIA